MANFFMGLAGVFVGLVLLALLLWAAVRFVFPWWLKRKVASAMDAGAGQPLAARITLEPMDGAWQVSATETLIAQMQAAGFTEVGRYMVPQMWPMQLWAGVHPDDGLAGVIYDHPQLTPMFDIVRVYADGRWQYATSNGAHDPANLPPGVVCVADRQLNPADALATVRQLVLLGQTRPVTNGAEFSAMFIAAYARQMDHTLSRPSPTHAQMQQIAQRHGAMHGNAVPQLNAQQAKMAEEIQLRTRLAALEEAITDHFLRSGQVSARQWEDLRPKLVVVHDRLPLDEAIDLALSRCDDADSHLDLRQDLLKRQVRPLQAFDAVHRALPADQQLQRVGHVNQPIEAWLYRGA